MRRALVLSVLFAVSCNPVDGNGSVAHADPVEPAEPAEAVVEAPCAGCAVAAPASKAAVPLLVVLHGDLDTARDRIEHWRAVARTRGWAVLSLQCPVAQGCDGSWYKWNGNPSWVTDQVAKLARSIDIDRTRVFLAGWSGGATYIGMHATHWARDFAAVVIHGGGQPPMDSRCPARALPAYFLVGDENVFHGAAKSLRAYFERCAQPVHWDLLQGAGHPAEDAALASRASSILDWLAGHARG